jgi:hypothetical protein
LLDVKERLKNLVTQSKTKHFSHARLFFACKEIFSIYLCDMAKKQLQFSPPTSPAHAGRILRKVLVDNKDESGLSISTLHRWCAQSYGVDFPSYTTFWRFVNGESGGFKMHHAEHAVNELNERHYITLK